MIALWDWMSYREMAAYTTTFAISVFAGTAYWALAKCRASYATGNPGERHT